MKPEESNVIKKALQYIKIARNSDHVTFRIMLASDAFAEEVIKPLQKISGWSEEDEESAAESARKFAEETKGRTLQEKSDGIKKILAISGGIAAAIAVAGGIALAIHQKGEKKKRNAES